jgi:hypothetical protein
MLKYMLTIEELKRMQPETIFAQGRNLIKEYCDNLRGETEIDWIAIRGGIHDWAIYYQLSDKNWDTEMIQKYGIKLHNEIDIKKLVECDDESFAMYRH